MTKVFFRFSIQLEFYIHKIIKVETISKAQKAQLNIDGNFLSATSNLPILPPSQVK
jgi:hypothetical protein